MGRFLNPDNSAFQITLNSKIYVDKTGLLDITNQAIDTDAAFICNSRPRRFGKSITANMLAAYYSKGCDSKNMFAGLNIGRMDSFEQFLNKYDVIHFDVQWCMMDAGSPEKTVSYLNRHIVDELKDAYPSVIADSVQTAYGAMSRINAETGRKFIVIIDEWDVLIRDEAQNSALQDEYIDFLCGMFKGVEPTRFISLAYLTGILPIKKLKTQSALNNFDEYTMLDAGELSPFVGFTDYEVKELSKQFNRDFSAVERWYDGYLLSGQHIYNPKAVVSVMRRGNFQSYWSKTGTFESIRPLINMDFDGLKTAIIEMISGDAVKVDTSSFQNDMMNFENKDDILTVLIHLGYLAYNQENHTAFIPNEEVRQEFIAATKTKKWNELLTFEQQSNALLEATLNMNTEEVATGIEKIHTEYASSIQYHDENSLSSVLTIAYLSSMQYYFKPVRELPAGRGFADFVFIPKPDYLADYPALVVELKWNKDSTTAIQQIKDRQYPESLLSYTGNILLVGISYDKNTKTHLCSIEKYHK
ncbi:MAG: ATP-binding protein [Fusicatenibacter sp.]|nr:ATP-binding protein [Fusicatenibacter sp.]